MGSFMKTLILIAVFVGESQAYRILVIVPIPSGSHAILGDALVKVLLGAGHEVAYVTAMPKRLQAHPNLVEADVSSNQKYFPSSLLNLTRLLDEPSTSPGVSDFIQVTTRYAMETIKHEAVQAVLNDGKKFDLVIAEWMFSELFAGLPAILDCPLIWFSSMEPHSMILSLVDEQTNPAYTTDFEVNHVPPFNFIQRVEQLIARVHISIYRSYHIYFKETAVFNDLFGPMLKKLGRELPSYNQLRYNASLVLSNSHVSLGQAIRLPQNFIPVGGYHIDSTVKSLPKDLMEIMDKATNGVIYFSMGSILKSKDFPSKLKMELLKMLGSLKQTVIWKFEEDFADLPRNVHVLKWASQQSILNHPNCILFITHGGLLSLTEVIHYGVPVIGIPCFADQFLNVMRAEQKGFAKKVDLTYDLAKDLKEAILEVTSNPKYKENAKALSFVYHHRPLHPRKEIAHWVEHVIKTRGAPTLKSPALQVPLYQKMYLDLAFLMLILLYVLRIIVMRLISFISIKLFNRDNDLRKKKSK